MLHTNTDSTYNKGGGRNEQKGSIRSKISENPPKLDKDQASEISSKWRNRDDSA